MGIYDLKVNHLNNPLGFKMDKTVFSWKVRNEKGKKQKSARICVANSIGDLNKKQNLLADTGFNENADSLCFEVPIKGSTPKVVEKVRKVKQQRA